MAFVQRVIANAGPRLAVFRHYAAAELSPPVSPGELAQVGKGLAGAASSLATVCFCL